MNPPAGHNPGAQRAQAGSWFHRHWKELLAVLAALIPVGLYFVLRGQASSQGSSNALPSGSILAGGSSGGSVSASSPVSTVTSWFATLRGNVNPETGQPFAGTVNIPVYDVNGVATGITLPEISQEALTGQTMQLGGKTFEQIVAPGGQSLWILSQDIQNLTQGTQGPAVNSNTPAQVFGGL